MPSFSGVLAGLVSTVSLSSLWFSQYLPALLYERPRKSSERAKSAIEVLQSNWYMTGADGSWIGFGPGRRRPDLCTSGTQNQSCQCNGYQGNWVRANVVEALCNYQIYTNSTSLDSVISASWPHVGFEANSAAPFHCNPRAEPTMPNADPGWPYYDDILWWALAYIRAAEMYSLRGDSTEAAALLFRSREIFDHVSKMAWNDTAAACGGGIWWSTHRSYKNAIANELFLVVAAKLKKRDWALKQWAWFNQSGMINEDDLINDGLGSHCRNNGATTYSYNQGVILGGLSHLHLLTGNAEFLRLGERIVDAVLDKLVDAGTSILAETNCGDGELFKGIFVRYLRYFLDISHNDLKPTKVEHYNSFLEANADSVWHEAQSIEGKFGLWWGGQTVFESGTVGLQTAAIDVMSAAQVSSAPTSSSTKQHDCGAAGNWVVDRCVCRTRFTGSRCEKEIRWNSYYSGRKVVIMTSTGRFVSSSGLGLLCATQSHLSGQEVFSVASCGEGVGFINSDGNWLAVGKTGKTSVRVGVGTRPVVAMPARFVNCSDTTNNATFLVGEDSDGFVALQSVAVASIGFHWILHTQSEGDTISGKHHSKEQLVVSQIRIGTQLAAARFRTTLQQHCQGF